MASSLVAFMGLTGTGKSSLINLLLGEPKAKVGHDIQSETSEVASYPLRYLGTDIVLIDTPGFDDTNKSDSEVLRILYTWLKTNYANGRKLNAIFYLHNITDKRMRGSSLSNLHAFKRLCGDGFFTSVLLGTTFWRDVSLLDTAEAVAREWELKSTDDFWKKMISGGATARSIPDTRADALKLLMQMAGKKARVLQVQSEAIDQGRSFEATTAHQALNERLAAARTQHTLEVNRLAAQSKRAREAREREAARVAETLRQRQQEERRELQRQEEAQREAAEAHRLRMAALREEQDLAEAREKELERAMQKLKIEDTRNEKRAKFKRRTDAQMYLLGNSSVNPEIFRSMVTAYVLICDNCFENIGVGRYYRCTICNDGQFDLCVSCHAAAGVFCNDVGHFAKMAIREQTDTQGNCPRVVRPTKSYHTITCNSCYGACAEVYYHCCSCRGDDFDICLDCVIRGKHAGCQHKYDVCVRYIQ